MSATAIAMHLAEGLYDERRSAIIPMEEARSPVDEWGKFGELSLLWKVSNVTGN